MVGLGLVPHEPLVRQPERSIDHVAFHPWLAASGIVLVQFAAHLRPICVESALIHHKFLPVTGSNGAIGHIASPSGNGSVQLNASLRAGGSVRDGDRVIDIIARLDLVGWHTGRLQNLKHPLLNEGIAGIEKDLCNRPDGRTVDNSDVPGGLNGSVTVA